MVVFKLDNWTLEKNGILREDLLGLVLKHTCPRFLDSSMAVPRVHVYPDSDQHCWRCTAPIPEGIIALYVLHEWDKQ